MFDLMEAQEGSNHHSIGILKLQIQYIDISSFDNMTFPE